MRGTERAGLPTSSLLIALIGALCVVGVVMVGSASEVVSIATYGSPWAILLREVMWMAIGIVVLVVTCRVDYRRWRRLGVPLLLVSLVLLLVVLVPGIGVSAGGSSRWIGFGQFRIQPSELAKLALAVFGADLVTRREQRGGGHRTIIGPLLLVALLAGGLVLLQPDMGTALVLACITLALLVASGVSMRPLAKVGGGLAALAVIVGLVEPYRRARILSFLDPTAHAKGSGYQVVQSLIGLGSGHVLGLGLGSSHEKWGLLPNAHTDFIYSVIGEELGLVGTLLVLAALGAFAWLGLRAAQRAPDRFGALLSVTLVAWVASEAFINIGAVVGLLPVTGIPLPFISFGGSSLVITLAAAGMLVNVARHEVRPGATRSRTRAADLDAALAGPSR